MSSRRAGGKPFTPSTNKGKGVAEASGPKVDQLSRGVAGMRLGSNYNPWVNPEVTEKVGAWNTGLGRGSTNAWSANARPLGRAAQVIPSPVILTRKVEPGRSWASVTSDSTRSASAAVINNDQGGSADDDDDSDVIDDSEDELQSDEFDSDTSQRSHKTGKENKWFKSFFDVLEKLTLEESNEPERQWHCPACKGGPGAIDWYRGLQPLVTHAKTKGSKRVKLHRQFAELLEEELRRKGTIVASAGESFGKWKGLTEDVKDRDIVWPPMVIVMNTRLDKDDNEKWIGMGNQELLDYFSGYTAEKARHSYGPQGHRGMSVLIFQSSVVGYLEAERLDKHFKAEGTDRAAWDCNNRALFYPGGTRQLYGYLAEKDDINIFNRHCQGKSKLKYEMRSYQEMVWRPMKQMNEDNQQLTWFKSKVAKEERHSKALEESFGLLSAKYRKTLEEHRVVRLRARTHHEQTKEELDVQEQFFKDQLNVIYERRDENEDKFEKLQQEERDKVVKQQQYGTKDDRIREEKIARFITIQEKEIEEFEAEREKLAVEHERQKSEMMRRHLEEELQLEKNYDHLLNSLMDKYAPHPTTTTTT